MTYVLHIPDGPVTDLVAALQRMAPRGHKLKGSVRDGVQHFEFVPGRRARIFQFPKRERA